MLFRSRHVRPVQVHVSEVAVGQLRQLRDRTDARVVPAVAAAPHRDRRAPVTVARQRPVDVVGEPVAEASVLDVLRMPVDLLVLAEKRVFRGRRAREPRGLRPVDEWCLATPAVRIRVGVVDYGNDTAASGEVGRASCRERVFGYV